MTQADMLRQIPAVNTVVGWPELAEAVGSRQVLLAATRHVLSSMRQRLMAGEDVPLGRQDLAGLIVLAGRELMAWSPRRVVNATGIVLHTNLGRAPLAPSAILAMNAAAAYSDLEYDLDTGARGSRHTHIEQLLCKVTGAEAAMAVNNNAAAVVLVLSALARGKEVIVSRGELVEIGGSFRVPDIMAESGCKLVEVGTTNRTRASDYEDAITADTGLILKVHTSNYRMVGFTESVQADELASLAHRHGLPLFFDSGSGLMVDLSAYGLVDEPVTPDLIKAGCDVVSFSGDKLFGGPQAGMIVGSKNALSNMKRHPLARALRLDKTTLAALSATLRVYAYGDPFAEIPAVEMLVRSKKDLLEQSHALVARLQRAAPDLVFSVIDADGYPGGGSFPGVSVRSSVVRVTAGKGSLGDISGRMRAFATPIIARVHDGAILIDPRTLVPGDDDVVELFFKTSL